MLQMLCEECNHFLEIAEAIRSLGLTILKGATEPRGEKTCIWFIVEVGSENRFILIQLNKLIARLLFLQ
jgi:hypothetical protein